MIKLTFEERQELNLLLEFIHAHALNDDLLLNEFISEFIILKQIYTAAKSLIDAPSWSGVSDKDCALEHAINRYTPKPTNQPGDSL